MEPFLLTLCYPVGVVSTPLQCIQIGNKWEMLFTLNENVHVKQGPGKVPNFLVSCLLATNHVLVKIRPLTQSNIRGALCRPQGELQGVVHLSTSPREIT